MPRILVVDDDPDILSILNILLTMQGFHVDLVSKGEMAFERIEYFNPDLILLDVLISGHDGRIICKRIKSDKEKKHLPVIMVSAHPAAAATIMDYGADDFVAKPFESDFLLEKIYRKLRLSAA